MNDEICKVAFAGTIYSLEQVVDRPALTDADRAKPDAAMQEKD